MRVFAVRAAMGPVARENRMICRRCKKRQATVHLTEVVGGKKIEKHLCEQCAVDEGITIKSHVSLNDLLSNFIMAHGAASEEAASLVCPECGLGFVEFRQNGLLGCPNDYEAFKKPLLGLLERAHNGGTRHIGKLPARAGVDDRRHHDLVRMRRELDEAVKVEDYETAARLRDRIKTLESADANG
jgi:protein arginine kinase activator